MGANVEPRIEKSKRGDRVRTALTTLVLAWCGCLVALIGPAVMTASAAPTATTGYGLLTTFGAGEFVGPDSGQVGEGYSGIAVDESTGNILATDAQVNTVRVFAPNALVGGTPLASFEAEYQDTEGGTQVGSPTGLVIDPTDGSVFTAVSPGILFMAVLSRYVSDGAPVPTYVNDAAFPGIPTPNDGQLVGNWTFDPTTGDLLYAAPSGTVRRFDATTGSLISSFQVKSSGDNRPIAVAADGTVYVQARKLGLAHYSATGLLLGELPVPGAVTAIAINPASGEIVISYNPSVGGAPRLHGFSPSGEVVFDTPAPSLGTYGLAFNPTGERLYSFNGTEINVFAPAVFPGAEAPVVTAITTTSAHVTAEADPGAGPPAGSEAHFEWSSDNGATWTSTPSQSLSGPSTVEDDITGLEVNSGYLVRFVVGNDSVTNTTAATPFTTAGVAPETGTSAASDVTETTAVLNGTINPIGLQTTYHFEYGLTTAYGSRIPVAFEAVAGGGRTSRAFSRTIAGLVPGATYHFRLVAQNSAGVSAGVDRTFATTAAGAVPRRAYEQVTPVEWGTDTLEPVAGFLSSADGNAYSYWSHDGLKGSPLFPRSISVRGADNWHPGTYLDPPINATPDVLRATTLGVSADFTHAFVVSNRDLTGGGTENGVNLYAEDIATGVLTLVGSSGAGNGFDTFTDLESGNKFVAGAADFRWVEFLSIPPLLPGAPSSGLYRWSVSSGLELVSVLPGGAATGVAEKGTKYGNMRWAADDGSRTYFTTRGTPENVYLRETGQSAAKLISHNQTEPETPQRAHLLDVSKDGRYAFLFSYSAPLATGAPEVEGGLYRYDAVDESLEYLNTTVTAGVDSNGAQGVSLGIGDDGDTLYFIGSAGSAEVWRGGRVEVLPVSFQNAGTPHSVSPDGRYFAWVENFNAAAGTGTTYVFDAETEETHCASCLPDGSTSNGILPGMEVTVNSRVPDAVTDAGQVFFTSSARLTPTDVNGERDVYVYENGRDSLISSGNAPYPAIFAGISEGARDVFFSTTQKLVGQDTNGLSDIYDARVNGGLPAQNPPPPQECLRDDCKATPGAGPELPFGGSEALNGPGNVTPPKRTKCAKGKTARKVQGKTRCVKASKGKKKPKPSKKKAKSPRQASGDRRQGR